MSNEKKIYLVDVEVTFDMAVAASSEEEARKLARAHWEDEYKDNYYHPVDFSVRPMTVCTEEFRGTLPWGLPSDHERRGWTVDKWFEADKEQEA